MGLPSDTLIVIVCGLLHIPSSIRHKDNSLYGKCSSALSRRDHKHSGGLSKLLHEYFVTDQIEKIYQEG